MAAKKILFGTSSKVPPAEVGARRTRGDETDPTIRGGTGFESTGYNERK